MTPSRDRRKYDSYFTWKKISIIATVLILILGAVVTLMTNIFGSRVVPRIVKLETYQVQHTKWSQEWSQDVAVEQAKSKSELAHLHQNVQKLMNRIDQMYLILLEIRRNGSGSR